MPGKRAEGVRSHNIAIHDDLWEPAMAKAQAEGRSLADVIRELLREFLDRPQPDLQPEEGE